MKSGFSLAHIFSDNMVLQQGVEIPVWGEAESGAHIRVDFMGETREAAAAGGKWHVCFSPAQAGGPYSMQTVCLGREITLDNILVGEVWLASGQSNMEYMLRYTREGIDEIPSACYNGIRLYTAPRIAYEENAQDAAAQMRKHPAWQVCSPETAEAFSAAAYHFIKNVHVSLGIPVGIIHCSWGGTSASCWMSRERIENCDEIRVYLDEYREILKCQDKELYELVLNKYNDSVAKHLKWAEEEIQFDANHVDEYFEIINKNNPYPWPPPMGPKCELRPAGIYYTMLRKIIPFPIKGVIWYQGETDTCKPHLYCKLFSEMVANWREDWKAPQMPFLFVQLTSYGGDDPGGEDWALLREQQWIASLTIENVAMAVSIDCGDKTNIHPIDKKPVGERLSLLALAKVYGKEMECSGPVLAGMDIVDGAVVLSFTHTGNGLIAKGGDLKAFQIRSEGSEFVDACAMIQGDNVIVHNNSVTNPTAVRYGWARYTGANLFNSAGLPASPFRTDNPIIRKLLMDMQTAHKQGIEPRNN